MIKRVWSDLPDFKESEFHSGFNCVIAERDEDSLETESTNGLGKTTLIRIMQFCLGSDLSRDKVLNHQGLKEAVFGLDFECQGDVYTVSRSTHSGGDRVSVSQIFLRDIPLEVLEEAQESATITLDDWRKVLTLRFLSGIDSSFSQSKSISVQFREISHYFMRIGKAAFTDPRQTYSGQSGRRKQMCIAYLLSLNWQSQGNLHEKKEKLSEVSKAIKVLKSAEGEEIESIGDMEAERVVLEAEVERLEREVENFNVLDDYAELEAKLAKVDKELFDEINENHAESKLLEHYQLSSEIEHKADPEKPLKILKDAGALFREDALKKIEEVTEFHDRLYRNRKAFLSAEVLKLKKTIRNRNKKIKTLTSRKAKILHVLDQSGAFESFMRLERGLTDMRVGLKSLRLRIEDRKAFDRKKDKLTIEISEARAVLKNDLEDRREAVDEAMSLFAEYSSRLYGAPAKLGIDITHTGYRFKVTIERDGSEGVEQMSIFCFDLMLATLRARRNFPFLTLIHDSTMFADVDPRQYGLALQLAQEESEAEGFQYICCLNAGALPLGHLGELNLDKYTRLRITDDNDKTRLLGKKLSARETS